MIQAGREHEHVTQCIRLVHADALHIVLQRHLLMAWCGVWCDLQVWNRVLANMTPNILTDEVSLSNMENFYIDTFGSVLMGIGK